MNIRLVVSYFSFLCFFSKIFPSFVFSGDGKIILRPGTNFHIETPVAPINGFVFVENSAFVSGGRLTFSEGGISEGTRVEKIEGTFDRDFTTTAASLGSSGVVLSGGHTLGIAGTVKSGVFVTGLNNRIAGCPKFLNKISLDPLNSSSLTMAITSGCDAEIDLAGNTLNLELDLQMSSGHQIISSSGPATVNLGGQTLFIDSGSSAWNSSLLWAGGGTIVFDGDLSLSSTWDFQHDTVIQGNGNTFDLSANGAILNVQPGVTLELVNINLIGLETDKIVLVDNTSTILYTKSTIVLSDDFDQSFGNLKTVDSKFVVGTHYWKLAPGATFENLNGNLWIDTKDSIQPPVFGQAATTGFVDFVDNVNIRQMVDYNQAVATANRKLISGNVDQDLAISANTTIKPGEVINVTENVNLNADGANLNFNGSSGPQLSVSTDKTLTISGNTNVTIGASTLDLADGSNLAFNGNSKINLSSDVTIPSGKISIPSPPAANGVIPTKQSLTISGAGGTQRFGLAPAQPGQPAPTIDVGLGDLIIQNSDFYGIEQVKKSKFVLGKSVQEGRVVLNGSAKIHIKSNCDMNFKVVGENNYLIIENNDLVLSGKIEFDSTGNNTLIIRFDLENEVDRPTIKFGPRIMNLFSSNGIARLIFENTDVYVSNLDQTSFVTGGHSLIDGFRITISQNPIVQGTSDLALGDSLDLRTDDTIASPILFHGDRQILVARGFDPEFKSAYHFPSLPLYENFFKNLQLCKSQIPRPNVRIIKSMVNSKARGVIRLFPGASLTQFGSDPIDPLVLQFSGNSTIFTPSRRQRRTKNLIGAGQASMLTPDFSDSTYLETIKATDTIYVSGVSNTIVLTGNMIFMGKIILDEGAELIFQFDDSVDTPKAIKFMSGDLDTYGISLPPSSSIIFQGNGQVLFQDQAVVSFNGSLPSLISGTSNTYLDNRPNLIFKNYAQMDISAGEQVGFGGKGQILFQDSAQLMVKNGSLLIGADSSDLFTLTIDRKASVFLGAQDNPYLKTESISLSPARLSLGYGDFSFKMNKGSSFTVENGAIFEVGLLAGQYTGGHVSNFQLYGQSTFNIENSGRLAFAQSTINQAGSTASDFYFDSTSGTIGGSGFVLLYKGNSTIPVIEGRVHNKQLWLSGSSALELVKSLIRETKLRSEITTANPNLLGLEVAADYFDSSGNYKLITGQNVIVELQSGDIIRREVIGGGTVFGTAANGVNFGIFPDGTRENT